MKWFQTAQKVIGLLALVISLVERPGEGTAKKAEAMSAFRSVVNIIDKELWNAPDWLVNFLTAEVIVGSIVDFLVANANRLGIFTSGDSQG